MTFIIKFSQEVERCLERLKRKDACLFREAQKKIVQIAGCDSITINHFKNLRGSLSRYKRVHVGSFVLFFEVDCNTVIFGKFVHHDNTY